MGTPRRRRRSTPVPLGPPDGAPHRVGLADAAGAQRHRELLEGRARRSRADRLHDRQAQDRARLAGQAEALGDDPVAHDGRVPPREQRGVPRRHLRPRDPDARAARDPRPRARRLRAGDARDGAIRSGTRRCARGCSTPARLVGFEDAERNEPLRIPFVAHAARHARGIVVHSPFVERYLRAFGCRTPVFVAPHPVVERDERRPRRRTSRAGPPGLARDDGHADPRRRVRRSERGQAHRRGARRSGAGCPRTCTSSSSAGGSPGTTLEPRCARAASADA